MFRAIALSIALMLTGTPAALACMGACNAMSVQERSNDECRHPGVPATAFLGAASEQCATPLAETPFLVETQQRAPGPFANPLALAPTWLGTAVIGFPADMPAFGDSPPVPPRLSPSFTTVLRI